MDNNNDSQTKFTELASRYLTENVRVWQRYGDMLRQLSTSRPQTPSLQSIQEFATRDGVEFISQVMQLNLNYYSSLLDMGVDFTNRMFGKAAQPEAPAQSPPSASAAATPTATTSGPTFELEFSGRHGETPSSPFVVANKKAEVAEVSFEISEFASEDGRTRFRSPVEFTPDPFVLQPGAEQIVECRLPIDAKFVPGARYMALVRVTGFPGMEIGLIVTPFAAAGESIPATPAGTSATPVVEQGQPSQTDHVITSTTTSKKKRSSAPRKKADSSSQTKTRTTTTARRLTAH